MTDFSGDEMVALFEQHLTFLREVRDAVSAHTAASQEMIGRSRPLIVQIDEQIKRLERELGRFGGHARDGPEPSCADDEYASGLAMPRFTKGNTRDLSDAQVTELNERYEQSIKWLTTDLPNYNGMCDHIAENVLCAYEVSQIFSKYAKA